MKHSPLVFDLQLLLACTSSRAPDGNDGPGAQLGCADSSCVVGEEPHPLEDGGAMPDDSATIDSGGGHWPVVVLGDVWLGRGQRDDFGEQGADNAYAIAALPDGGLLVAGIYDDDDDAFFGPSAAPNPLHSDKV